MMRCSTMSPIGYTRREGRSRYRRPEFITLACHRASVFALRASVEMHGTEPNDAANRDLAEWTRLREGVNTPSPACRHRKPSDPGHIARGDLPTVRYGTHGSRQGRSFKIRATSLADDPGVHCQANREVFADPSYSSELFERRLRPMTQG